MATFSGPVDQMPFAPPLERWTYDRGRTVYRSGGTWVEGSDFEWDILAAADVVAVADRPGGEKVDGVNDAYVFLGGRVYEVSSAVATALTNAGYSEYLT